MRGNILYIDKKQAIDFLLPRHYSGRKPQISQAFGWFYGEKLQAVCSFGKPASNSLCTGICGEIHSANVYELNRLCREDDWCEPMSQFVSACLRRLATKDWIVVSYADTGMSHVGYIYQATNWLYTGCTKPRTDKWTEGNKHSRHYDKKNQIRIRKVRSAKHRYVYFCTRNKRLKKQWLNDLNYPILEYPKGESKNYTLGDYLSPKLIRV